MFSCCYSLTDVDMSHFNTEEVTSFARMFSNIKITFPLIADLSQTIARRYGMVHPASNNTKTVRAVFFIDPDGIIRTILYYPASTGRNFHEIMRILKSLQTSDAFRVATPADWEPGDDVIKTSPDTLDGAISAAKENKNSTETWFLTLSALPLTTIQKKLNIHQQVIHNLLSVILKIKLKKNC